jgi:hypothetical protein
MRHLFIVHSFATYHCALGVIRAERIPLSNCTLVEVRGFVCGNPPAGVAIGKLSWFGTPNLDSIRKILALRSELSSRDREIDALVSGEPFVCYLPHTYYDFADLVVSHPRCRGFSYIEEGLTSYYRPGEIDAAYPPWRFAARSILLRLLCFPRRLRRTVTFFRNDYVSVYGFGGNSFPGWSRKVELPKSDLFGTITSVVPDGSPILVFDALVELKRTDIQTMCNALDEFLNTLVKRECRELRYKFHGVQSVKSSIGAIKQVFSKHQESIRLIELDPSTCLENLFATSNSTVFVFNSASGIYASLAGRSA